jgi:hypothetical protein
MDAPDTRPVGKLEYLQRVVAGSDLHRTARTVARAYANYASADGSSVYPGMQAVAD